MPTDPEEKLVPLTKPWWEKVKTDYTGHRNHLLCLASKSFEEVWENAEYKATIRDLATEFLCNTDREQKNILVGYGVLFLARGYSVFSDQYNTYHKQLRLDFLDYCINNHQTTQSCLPPTNS